MAAQSRAKATRARSGTIPAGSVARAMLVIEPEHTVPLPPPSNWPEVMKRLACSAVTGAMTWGQWTAPFPADSHEPMWLALRAKARSLRGGWKVLANDEAWTVCTLAARRILAEERAA